ncbi:hypothetical protein [Enterococcus faecalis]|uniref:hypothetical protein n=1 Tax=Enterococcus faecalis TaxID=1351 RepID=UPI001785659D|nr:hypothetical protein [Enterococcus faecalis]MBD9787327.1 hypothetical protein [Enterococcus faecalis]MBD9814767.1 hypothetical protein [Enterococcus faecalis]
MAKVFFSKMNINDDIFEVYNGKKEIDSLLTKIYNGITNKSEVYDEFGGRYKFFDIDKFEDNSIIHGRLGYIKKGVHSTYDPEKDTAIDVEDKNKIEYITFYFDVHKEMVSYTVTPSLTRKKVLEMFANLIRKSTNIGVVFVLETDIKSLETKLAKMEILRRINLTIVSPNGDKDAFAKLFSLNADKIAKSDATKIKQEYSNQKDKGLNKDSELVKDAIDGIGLGYAEGVFVGKDSHNEPIEINTVETTPYTKILRADQSKNKQAIAEKGRAGIIELSAYKAQIREKNKNEENGKGRK